MCSLHLYVHVYTHAHVYAQCNYAITFFVAVFAGPEAIQRAHPTSDPTVVKNGQLTCVSY